MKVKAVNKMSRLTRHQKRVSRNHLRLKIIVHLKLYAPDEELAKTGETYCTLFRGLTLPFVPFVGLVLDLGESPLEDDPTAQRYSELFDAVSGPTMLHEIKRVYWFPSRNQFDVHCTHFEPTLDKFHSYIAFATEFSKFKLFDDYFWE